MNTPDLHATRFRRQWFSLLTRSTLATFTEKYPEYSTLSLEDFKTIIRTFNGNITQGVIDNRQGVELPEGLGFIFMGTCPTPKKENIDYKTSVALGTKVIFKNWNSDNKILKIFYTNRSSKYPFQNKQVWAFNAVRQFRRSASAAYRINYEKYIQVDPMLKVSCQFDTYRKKEYAKNLNPIIPDGYDEFKM